MQLSSNHTWVLKWCHEATVCEAEEQCFMKEHLVKSLFVHHTNPLLWVGYDLCMMQIGMIIDDVLGLWFTSPKPPHLHHLSVVPIKQTIYLTLVTPEQRPRSKHGCEDQEQWWRLLWLWFWCSKWCSWSWNIGWMLISSLQIYLKVGEESRISCLWLKILWSWGLVSSKSDANHRARERECSARADLCHVPWFPWK